MNKLATGILCQMLSEKYTKTFLRPKKQKYGKNLLQICLTLISHTRILKIALVNAKKNWIKDFIHFTFSRFIFISRILKKAKHNKKLFFCGNYRDLGLFLFAKRMLNFSSLCEFYLDQLYIKIQQVIYI